jgi:hypothetical protein
MGVHPHEPLKQAGALINPHTMTWDALLDPNAKFLLTLINKKAPLTGGGWEQGKLSLPYEGI